MKVTTSNNAKYIAIESYVDVIKRWQAKKFKLVLVPRWNIPVLCCNSQHKFFLMKYLILKYYYYELLNYYYEVPTINNCKRFN